MARQETMKSATLDAEIEQLEIKGWVEIPNREAFSVRMIAKIIDSQCPLYSPSVRTIQRAIAELRKLELDSILNPIWSATTPYYDRLATEMIIVQLKFKVKNPTEG